MRLGDRDNLVRIAHALFYVALVLALLWMFSCGGTLNAQMETVGEPSPSECQEPLKPAWVAESVAAHRHSLSPTFRFHRCCNS